MALIETSPPSPEQPLPRRKPLIVPELAIFGADYSDEQYREELEMYLDQKIVVSSTGIRHFRSRLGMTVKFSHDPVTIEKELSPLLQITSMPMSPDSQEALVIPWNHPELGIVKPFVPLNRAVTTIYMPLQ